MNPILSQLGHGKRENLFLQPVATFCVPSKSIGNGIEFFRVNFSNYRCVFCPILN